VAVKPPGPIDTDEEAAPAPEKEPESHGVLGFLKELPVLIVLAFVLALLIKTFLVQAFYIPSASMEPTLMPGDRVLVNKLSPHFGLPAHGDIIVFSNPHPTEEPQRNAIESFFHWVGEGLGLATPPNEDFIKRVIGLPGETVEGKSGKIFINGRQLVEPYLAEEPIGDFPAKTIPKNQLWVMGDNRNRSSDSRVFGPIKESKIVGRAILRIWPFTRLGFL
jgi:signal peptidase I